MCNLVINEIKLTGFWDSIAAQSKLRAELQKLLLSPEFVVYPQITSKYKELISRIMELAKANHFKMIQD